MILSRGARLCESIIRCARAQRGGVRSCGRPYLARRLGCSQRTVSRYVAELRDAGRLEVTPPRRHYTRRGWRTIGVNAYRLPCSPHPAPHVQRHNRRSDRGDSPVTPLPSGSRLARAQPDPGPLITPSEAMAQLRRRLTAERTPR